MQLRRILSALMIWSAALTAEVVEGRYIVESDVPAAMASGGVRPSRAVRAVSRAVLRQGIEARGGRVVHEFDTLLNAVVVEAPGVSREELLATPGVRQVYPVLSGKLHLDHAVNVNGIRAGWAQLAAPEQAGAGVRIAILDTGIDSTHPGFQDDSLTVPTGYPMGNRESDLKGANKKIIVARSYEHMLGVRDPSIDDVIGHGTAVAMTAAGVAHDSPIGRISGAAPKAWLGAYKIFGSNSSTTTDVVIAALEDAVLDKMDVINLSMGFLPTPRMEFDPVVVAVERAVQAGVLVVQSSGNEGPDPGTTSSPGEAQSIMTVGAQPNERALLAAVDTGEFTVSGLPPSGVALPVDPVAGPVGDVAQLDGTGLACDGLPAGRLSGRIALILRGVCEFRTKLKAAEAAGAIAAVIYSDDRPVAGWDPQDAALPGLLISQSAGLRLKGQVAGNPDSVIILRFGGTPFAVESRVVTSFSSRGPSTWNGIQPDLVAVGQYLYTAARKTTDHVAVGDPTGYTQIAGTSFSAPLAAGAAAVVKSVRPGLMALQYRSLLANTATELAPDGQSLPVMTAGAGMLNLDAALRATVSAIPSNLSFGAGGATVDVTQDLTLRNVSQADETFTVVAAPMGEGPTPIVSPGTVTIEGGSSRPLTVRFAGTGLAAGQYQGVLLVTGSAGGTTLRIPYWYGVKDGQPARITIVNQSASGRAGATSTFYVRVADLTDTPVDWSPSVSVTGGSGVVVGITSLDRFSPALWQVTVRLTTGVNAFEVKAGTVVKAVVIAGS